MTTAPASDLDDVVGEPSYDSYALAIQQTEPLIGFAALGIASTTVVSRPKTFGSAFCPDIATYEKLA